MEQDLAHRAEIAEQKAVDNRKHKFSAAPAGASSAVKRARSGAHGSGGGSSSRHGGGRQGSGADDSKTGKADHMAGKAGKAPLLSFGEDEED